MKHKEIERLKEIDRLREKLGDEFELITQSPDENDKFFVVIAKKKDPWEGVEFVYATDTRLIFKVISYDGERFTYNLRDIGKEGNVYTFNKSVFTPSTESAYVEQLKKEAFERFGEIKDGDRFESATGGEYTVSEFEQQNEWDYFKKFDQFFYKNVEIYCSGKWAKKLPERVKVEFITSNGSSYPKEGGKYFTNWYDFKFKFKNMEHKNLNDIGNYLAKCLEDYLNKEAGI